ncbi:MAG: 2,3-diphosphoglycerate-dependent phosphoglycerate mutase [bacterium]|nr:2,3-diphosphoglycerate-dependent phosphoglycerate mutase [bacterium]
MPNLGKLVLVRHGASEWNIHNIFTGWMDVPLAEQGIEEAHEAGKKLKGLHFDIAFTSVLSRAIDTQKIILDEIGQSDILVFKDQALNERHYGALQGKNKDKTREEFGEEQVQLWRRSYDIAPPEGESLKDTCDRTIPYLTEKILTEVKQGKNVLVTAHGNSLRSIVMKLEKLSPDEIIKVNIPTGVPYIYTFDTEMNVINREILNGSISQLTHLEREVQ